LAVLDLGAHGGVVHCLPDVGREIRHRKHLAHFDHVAIGCGTTLRPFDRSCFEAAELTKKFFKLVNWYDNKRGYCV